MATAKGTDMNCTEDADLEHAKGELKHHSTKLKKAIGIYIGVYLLCMVAFWYFWFPICRDVRTWMLGIGFTIIFALFTGHNIANNHLSRLLSNHNRAKERLERMVTERGKKKFGD